MAEHAQFTIDTGVQVCFCDPKNPRRTDMAALTQEAFDQAATSLNNRPRQTLGWKAPSQKLAEVLR